LIHLRDVVGQLLKHLSALCFIDFFMHSQFEIKRAIRRFL